MNPEDIIDMIEALEEQRKHFESAYLEEKRIRESHHCPTPNFQGRLETLQTEKASLEGKVTALESKIREYHHLTKQEPADNLLIAEISRAKNLYPKDIQLQERYRQLQKETLEKTKRMKSILGLPETAQDEEIMTMMITNQEKFDHPLLEDQSYLANDEKVINIFQKSLRYAIAGCFTFYLTVFCIPSYFQHLKTMKQENSSSPEMLLMDSEVTGEEETPRFFDGGLPTKNQDEQQQRQTNPPKVASGYNSTSPPLVPAMDKQEQEKQNRPVVVQSAPPPLPLHPSCGNDTVKLNFAHDKPANWNEYQCRKPVGEESCLTIKEYLPDKSYAKSHHLQYGCLVKGKLCCPPIQSNERRNLPSKVPPPGSQRQDLMEPDL